MNPRLPRSRYRHVRQNAEPLSRLVEFADLFDFDVKFHETKSMRHGNIDGLWCPDTQRIYVVPNERVVGTLAHEIGHLICETILPTDREDVECEQIADIIGWALCRWVGSKAPELEPALKEISR